MTDERLNPYAPPGQPVQAHRDSPARERICAVYRAFRLLGWIGAVPFGAGTAAAVVGLIVDWFLGSPWNDTSPLALVVLLYAGLFTVSILFLRTARQLRAGSPTAPRGVYALSCLLLLGFPLLTIVGLLCMYDVRRWYPEYRRELDLTGDQW